MKQIRSRDNDFVYNKGLKESFSSRIQYNPIQFAFAVIFFLEKIKGKIVPSFPRTAHVIVTTKQIIFKFIM